MIDVRADDIDVGGYSTRYRSSGGGEPVVLIHGDEFGFPGGSAWRDSTFEALSRDGRRIIAVDRLGQGYTDPPADPAHFRMSGVVEHFAQFLSSSAVGEPAHLVGHSRGAYVAAATAFRYPELVRSLVLVNTASLSFDYDGEAVPGTRTYHVYHELRNGEVAHDLAVSAVRTEFLTSEFVAQCAEEFGRPSNVHSREVIGGPARKDYFAEFKRDRRHLLERLKAEGAPVPTLVVWGVGDPTTTLEEGVMLYEAVSGQGQHSRLYVISECGHAPFLEYEDDFNQAVAAFLSGLAS